MTGDIVLLNLPKNENIANALRGVLSIFESVFPERIRGYYIVGSYADGSSLATSDIDLTIVFKGCFEHEQELTKAQFVRDACTLISSVEVDVEIVDEETLAQGMWPDLKLNSLLIYGEDVRDRFPLLPIKQWTCKRMHAAYWLMTHLFERNGAVAYPLDYPDPLAEFYGYDSRRLRLPNGEEVKCTRDLMRVTGWAATAILAFQAGEYVARKSDCHKLYREYIDVEESRILQDIYEKCRGRWNYLLPVELTEREQLRAICERTLDFENHFLRIYRDFLFAELRSGD